MGLYSDSANAREEVTLEWDFSVNPPALTARVTARVSRTDGSSEPAWESRATCRRVLPSLLPLSEAQKQIVGRYVVGGDFSQLKNGSPPAYLLLQVTNSGRLLWNSRRPGHSGAGVSSLVQEGESLFSAKFYEGQSTNLAGAGAKLSHSWAGGIVLSQQPDNRWRAAVNSEELPSALELQSSCLALKGGSIAFVPDGSNWSNIRSVHFTDLNSCVWHLRSGSPDILRTPPSLLFSLQPGTEEAEGSKEQNSAATVSSTGVLRLLPTLNSNTKPPLPVFQFNRVTGEFRGIYNQPGVRTRVTLNGFVMDSAENPKLRAQGWIESGAFPFVTFQHWSLLTE
jgi:hypothetical protein